MAEETSSITVSSAEDENAGAMESLLGNTPPAQGDGMPTAGEALPATPEEYQMDFAENTSVDQNFLGSFQQWAHANKVPLAAAKELARQYESMVAGYGASQAGVIKRQSAAWLKELKADPAFGGGNWNESMQALNAAMREFGSEELRGFLTQSGLDNNPLLNKFVASVGRALLEPGLARGSNSAGKEKSAAEVLYPNHK